MNLIITHLDIKIGEVSELSSFAFLDKERKCLAADTNLIFVINRSDIHFAMINSELLLSFLLRRIK